MKKLLLGLLSFMILLVLFNVIVKFNYNSNDNIYIMVCRINSKSVNTIVKLLKYFMLFPFYFNTSELGNIPFVFCFREIRHAQEAEKEVDGHNFPKFATNQQNH